MRRSWVALVATTLLVCAHHGSAHAARTVRTDSLVWIKLELLQPTAVIFPEAISTITVGMSEATVSLDYQGPYVFLLAKTPEVNGRLFAVGKSGKLYLLYFKVASPADDSVTLTHGPTTPKPGVPSTGAFTPTQFLRALRLNTALPGAQTVEMPVPTPLDAAVKITQMTSVEYGGLIGSILTLENTLTTPLAIEERIGERMRPEEGQVVLGTWAWPPRLTIKALAPEIPVITPQGSARVFVIWQRRS